VKIVTKATIEVVKAHQLNDGDHILVTNRKCEVTTKGKIGKKTIDFVSEDGCVDSSIFETDFLNYYRIIDCKEKKVKF